MGEGVEGPGYPVPPSERKTALQVRAPPGSKGQFAAIRQAQSRVFEVPLDKEGGEQSGCLNMKALEV